MRMFWYVGCFGIALGPFLQVRRPMAIFWVLNVDVRAGLEYAEHELDRQYYDYYNNECSDYAQYHTIQYTSRVEMS